MDEARELKALKDLAARREKIPEEMRQLVRDAEHWNRLHPNEEPIIVDASRTSGHALMVRIGKEERPLTEWCALKGISYQTVRSRMNRGMKVLEALHVPAGKPLCIRKAVTHRGVTMSLTGWAKRSGMSVQALRYRLKAGMPFEQAVSAPRMNRWTRRAA